MINFSFLNIIISPLLKSSPKVLGGGKGGRGLHLCVSPHLSGGTVDDVRNTLESLSYTLHLFSGKLPMVAMWLSLMRHDGSLFMFGGDTLGRWVVLWMLVGFCGARRINPHQFYFR